MSARWQPSAARSCPLTRARSAAYLLAPLAPTINWHMERSRRRLVGTYEGWPVRLFIEPQRSVGVFAERTSATSRITYTDDVSASRVPSNARFAVYLALVARLAALNNRVNTA